MVTQIPGEILCVSAEGSEECNLCTSDGTCASLSVLTSLPDVNESLVSTLAGIAANDAKDAGCTDPDAFGQAAAEIISG